MPTFLAYFYTPGGKRDKRREQGESKEAVRRQLVDAGLFVTDVIETKTSTKTTETKVYKLKLSENDLCEIMLQLEIQLTSGTFLHEALETIKDEFPSYRGRFFLREVYSLIENSRTGFVEAVSRFPRVFPKNILTILRSGESQGTPELAARLKEVRERMVYVAGIRKQVIWAMVYPVSVAILGTGLLIFLQAGLFPKLIQMLADMGVSKLPPITVLAIALSHFFSYWWKFMVAALVLIPIALVTLRRFKTPALLIDSAFLRLPMLGKIYTMLSTALVFHIYRSLYSDGRETTEILDLCMELSPNRAISAGLMKAKLSILSGEPPDVAFRRAGCFPKMACATIHAGLKSGNLKRAMEYISDVYTTMARDRIALAVGTFTWSLFAVLAIFVAITVLGFFSAVYGVIQSVH